MTNELTQKQVTTNVASRIEEMEGQGLVIARNYAVLNALNAAYYQLTNSDNGNLLLAANSQSVYNSLLDMVIQGLDPAKKQCYFVKYGSNIKLMRSYFGTQKVLKDLENVDDVWAEIIYDGDDVEIEVVNGHRRLVSHKTHWQNQNNPIAGAYCVIKNASGEEFLTIMTKAEIDESWSMSKSKSKNVHRKFPQEMAKRTVINRAAKRFINTSNASNLFIDAVNRTTENEYEIENKQPKDVTPKEESLDDFLNGAEEAAAIVDSEVDDQELTSTSEVPVSESESELQSETLSEETTLFDQLGDLYD